MKQNKHKKSAESLRQKLLFYFLGFSVIILAALWIMQTIFFDDLYQAVKTQGIERSADYICENINDENIVGILDQMYLQNNMHIEVYDIEKYKPFEQLYSSRSQKDPIADFMPHELHNFYTTTKAVGGKELFLRGYIKADADGNVAQVPKAEQRRVTSLICVRVFESDNTEFMVLLYSAVTPYESTVLALRLILVIITALLIVLSVTMSLLISWRFSKPLKDTNEKAKMLAVEDYSVTFDSKGYKEIEELNATLNLAASELGVASDLRKELIANVSHDLRTPLTMIKGYAEVMRDIPGEMNEENLKAIVDESTRLSNLVSDLLDISKLQSGAVPIEKKVFSLTDCTSDILSRFSNFAQQQGYSLSFESLDEALVFADRARIEQVLYNLISNAVNYSGDRKEVKVTEKITGDTIRVEIADSGNGIEPEKLKLIWDRYYRADKNHQRAVVGTGLGLSIVKEILDLHDARYGVLSKVGEGCTFWFELPIYFEK